MNSLHPLRRKFWANVQLADGCWEWDGARTDRGYGKGFVAGHRSRFAHRVAYELLVGPVPEGLELDHLCRNHACCNPAHLEAVTHWENVRRGEASVDACRRSGHPYTAENTRMSRVDYRRYCRACERERYVRRRAAA